MRRAALVFVLAATARAQNVDSLADRVRRVDAIFASVTGSGPGCAVGVVQGGRLIVSRGYGLADLEAGSPITATTLFNAGSLTKQFTAAALLLLVETHRVSLDDDVHQYVPELPNYHARVTLRELLHHTSGIKDDGTLMQLAGWDHWGDVHTQRDALAVLRREASLNFAPGTRFLYSDSGYDLLALVVERVTGISFRAYVEHNVFAPLGMASSHIADDYTEVFRGLANAYVIRAGQPHRAMPRLEMVGGSGLITSVADLAKWDAEFYTAAVGGMALVDSLLAPGLLNGGDTIPYAAGLEHGNFRGVPFVEHDGGYGGYASDMMRFPQSRLMILVLCNVRTNPKALARRIADIFLDSRASTVEARATIVAPPAELTRGSTAPRSALYYDDVNTDLFAVRIDSTGLSIVEGQTLTRLWPVERGVYADSASGDCWIFSNAGRRALRYHGTKQLGSAERVAPPDTSPARLQRYAGDFASGALNVTWTIRVEHGQLVLRRWRTGDVALAPEFANAFSGGGFLYRFRGARADSLEVIDDRLHFTMLTRRQVSAARSR